MKRESMLSRQRDTLLRLIKEAPIGIPQEDN